MSSWRDLPTPSSTPAKPMPATQMLQQHLRPMRPPSSDGSSPQTAVGGPSHVDSRSTTSTAWPEVGPAIAATGSHAAAATAARRRSTAGTHPPHHFDSRAEAFTASSDLALQYRVASATSEELAAKVHVLQQQLALQVWSLGAASGHSLSYHGTSMHISCTLDRSVLYLWIHRSD